MTGQTRPRSSHHRELQMLHLLTLHQSPLFGLINGQGSCRAGAHHCHWGQLVKIVGAMVHCIVCHPLLLLSYQGLQIWMKEMILCSIRQKSPCRLIRVHLHFTPLHYSHFLLIGTQCSAHKRGQTLNCKSMSLDGRDGGREV